MNKLIRQQIILVFAIALALVIFNSCFTGIQSQPTKPVVSTLRFDPLQPPPEADRGAPSERVGGASRLRFVPPPTPPNRGAPSGRQQGGASRGQCPAVGKPLTALVPASEKTSVDRQSGLPGLTTLEALWGLTVVEYPTLWFYVPYSLTPHLPINFVLQDEQGKEVYETSFTVSQTPPGIVKFRLPSTAPLEIGKMYHWFFSINCAPDDPVFVEGWVQRVAPEPTLASQLQKATPRQRVALYATSGIWHNALTALAELRSANPGDATLIADWVSLLHSVGLEAIAQEPIVQCCTPDTGKKRIYKQHL